jgi:hypothetical protein
LPAPFWANLLPISRAFSLDQLARPLETMMFERRHQSAGRTTSSGLPAISQELAERVVAK